MNAGALSSPLPPARSRRYQWLLFDADGTLFDYERAEITALEQSFRLFGVPFQPSFLAAYRSINRELWQELERGRTTPEQLKVLRFERLLASLNLPCPPAAFSEAYLRFLGACADLIPGALEILQACRDAYRIAIVTNGLTTVQRSRMAHSAIRPYIAEIIISEEIGVAKPDARFFDATFARLGHPPRSKVLMIGDNWSSDIVGAAGYGLDTCWYNPKGETRPATPGITHEVRALSELAVWLR